MAKKTFGLLTLAGVLLYGSIGVAAPENYGEYPAASQEAAANKIFTDNYDFMNATRQALATKRAELDALLASPYPDADKIQSLSREIGDLRGQMLAARANMRAQLQKEGLPPDYFAPEYRRDYGWGYDPHIRRGGYWRHGGHHGHGDRGWGCGCW